MCRPFISRVRARMHAFKKDHSIMMKALLWLQVLFVMLLRLWPPIKRAGQAVWYVMYVYCMVQLYSCCCRATSTG